MAFPKEIMEYWQRFKKNKEIAASFVDAWSFGDNHELADELLALVLAGKKTGTATLVIELEKEGLKIPEIGDYNIILNGKGTPAGIIRTTSVIIKPFNEVDEKFAYSEGEDDRTLESWRREHWKCWTRVSKTLNFEMKYDLLVICENFELIFTE